MVLTVLFNCSERQPLILEVEQSRLDMKQYHPFWRKYVYNIVPVPWKFQMGQIDVTSVFVRIRRISLSSTTECDISMDFRTCRAAELLWIVVVGIYKSVYFQSSRIDKIISWIWRRCPCTRVRSIKSNGNGLELRRQIMGNSIGPRPYRLKVTADT